MVATASPPEVTEIGTDNIAPIIQEDANDRMPGESKPTLTVPSGRLQAGVKAYGAGR